VIKISLKNIEPLVKPLIYHGTRSKQNKGGQQGKTWHGKKLADNKKDQ
jgi:hypothetical protein